MHTIKIKHCLVHLNQKGVVIVQHPTVWMKNRFNNVNKSGRVLSHDNTMNLGIIIVIISRGKNGTCLFVGGGL
jgi:hypothetical protein